ncbi:hypothetical protein L6452_37293 [Arctium lappa]|uniref:Uncharacterized protein n=1 Tax=Arctium lappa TaxID=4217 RepID=A0ACB8Y6Q3_ARCLA|nr:hypothetical protein L6452_37293 [Arctium lappa]
MAITKSKPRKRSHAELKGDESSSENSPNKHPSPSKKIAKEKQPPAKRLTRSSSQFKTKTMTEDKGSAIALTGDSREKNSKEVDSEAVISKLSTTALDALAAVVGAEVQTPETTPVQAKMIIPAEATSVAVNPFPTEVTKTPPLVSPSKILDDTLSKLLGINITLKNQDQHSVNPTPPVKYQLIDEPSEETLEPSLIASQNTEPLETPVKNPYVNMAIGSPVDEATPQFNIRAVKHSPSINHVSPVHTASKKPKAKKKKKQTTEVEVAEDTKVEDISPPKRITRQGAQSMAQPEGSNRAVLQKSHNTAEGSKGKASNPLRDNLLMRFTNNPRPPSIIEAVEEMKNTILGEVQKATAWLKKTFKARTNKLKGKINGL